METVECTTKMNTSHSKFIHDIEDVAQAISALKHHVKRALLAQFQLNVDYVIKESKPSGVTGGRPRSIIYMTDVCRRQLITTYSLRCRKELAETDALRVEYVKRYLPKETETLDFIERAFAKNFRCIRQYDVDRKYKIDLFFPDQRIALECDENGHADRDVEDDASRQAYIECALDCVFIRFNPDAATFDLAELMSTVLDTLLHR